MRWLRRVGVALVVLAVLGFLTVANDWRHTGELLGVGSVLFVGVVPQLVAFQRGKNHG